MPTRHFFIAFLLSTLLASGCAPLPSHVYLAEPGVGRTQYSSCAFNSHVPTGLALDVMGIDVIVHLSNHDGRPYLEMRLDIPEGKTVELQDASVEFNTEEPKRTLIALFPSASLVDNPIVNSYSSDPGLQRLQLLATSKLIGGKVHTGSNESARHFWFATYVDLNSAETVFVTLPNIRISGVLVHVPQISFNRKLMVVVALVNC